jgi:non-heme chloroperoxidase
MRPVPSEPTLMSRLPPMIDVPTLVADGTADRVLPFISATAERLSGLISDVKLVPIKDGPHAITWTQPDGVNTALLEFLAD